MRLKILPSRNIHLALQSKVKQELDNLVKRNVITFVNEPTERVRQMHITHVTSSPGHQQENVKAEAAVKAAKHLLKTSARNDQDQYLALLELRNTPRQDVNVSRQRRNKGTDRQRRNSCFAHYKETMNRTLFINNSKISNSGISRG